MVKTTTIPLDLYRPQYYEAMDESLDIDPIVTKYIREEPLTTEEELILAHWVGESEERQELLERLKNDPDWTKENLVRMSDLPYERVWEKVTSRLENEGFWRESAVLPLVTAKSPVQHWWRTLIAASIFVAAAGSAFWLYRGKPTPAIVSSAPAPIQDVQPGGDKAILTLADGSKIDLDSTANGVLTSQGNTLVAKLDGHLAYNAAASASEKPATPTFNILSTPRAGQFTLSLPDGTKVWLNNASSLRYPVWFTGATREVELTGEAYFEVAKDAVHPFRVRIQNSSAGSSGGLIDVLGTSFNIMAYSDENAERATLVDGSIRYVHGESKTLLKPAEQSVFDAAGELKTLPHVNVDEITAWKNGYFHFDHANLQTTMRQLARWYDITVDYQGTIPKQEFVGKIQRSMPLSVVLKGLEGEHVHFKLSGRDLTVIP